MNTQWKTCWPIYVYVVGNILSQVIFSFLGGRGRGDFNVLLMKLKEKKNTNYLRWKINYNIYIQRNLSRSHHPRHHTGRTDANPWKSKIWRLSLLHHHPTPPPPLPPNRPIGLKHYMNSYMKYRPSYNSLLWSWRPTHTYWTHLLLCSSRK